MFFSLFKIFLSPNVFFLSTTLYANRHTCSTKYHSQDEFSFVTNPQVRQQQGKLCGKQDIGRVLCCQCNSTANYSLHVAWNPQKYNIKKWSPIPQPPNPNNNSQWHFIHWRFLWHSDHNPSKMSILSHIPMILLNGQLIFAHHCSVFGICSM